MNTTPPENVPNSKDPVTPENPGSPGSLGSPTNPEDTVRVAWAADAAAIADVQYRAWRESYASILPREVFQTVNAADLEARWASSLARPADARNRALVAVGPGSRIVGMAVTGPCEDPDADRVADGEIQAFHVAPDAQGAGHGSRLLQASVDTLRADGFSRALTWVFSADDPLRRFLDSAGWSADGAHRSLAMSDNADPVKQVRLHCSLT